MNLSDFDFDLPEALIATRPARPRSAARLLVADGHGLRDLFVRDLVDQFRAGDRLILNNTRVIPARLFGTRQRLDAVAKVEVTLLEPLAQGWRALAKPLRKVQVGEVIRFSDDLSATVAQKSETDLTLAFNLTGPDFDAALQVAGQMPLPPYIQRDADADDDTRYQTVFARHAGAVAAPTAGLHFDEALLAQLQAKGVQIGHITLHVGAGTFQPMRAEHLKDHVMHSEWLNVGADLCAQIAAAKARGGRVIAVGTTVLRALETAIVDGTVKPFAGDTQIFIFPGYRIRSIDALITNFHLPESTLLMLVSAFAGKDRIFAAYRHAVDQQYRFFSYGDAMLLHPGAAA